MFIISKKVFIMKEILLERKIFIIAMSL